MSVLGGVHHFLGPLWGAIVFIPLEDRLSAVTENWWLIFAPIIMIFALFSPEGIQGWLSGCGAPSIGPWCGPAFPAVSGAVIAPYDPPQLAADPEAPILTVRD